MLSNKTRNKIKEHFEKHIDDDTYKENYEKDFTVDEEIIEDFLLQANIQKYSEFNKIENYRYVGDELLDLNDVSLKGDISVIMYNINDTLFKPFLMFLLEKKDDTVRIPIISSDKPIKPSNVTEKLKVLLEDSEMKHEIEYQGFYNNKGEIFVFYKLVLNYFSSDAKFFFTSVLDD